MPTSSTPTNAASPVALRRRALAASPYHGPALETYKRDARSSVWRVGIEGQGGGYVVKRFEYAPLRQRLGLWVGLHPAQLELRRNAALVRAGVPVAAILDAGVERAGAGCRVWLITPRVGESLQRLVRDPASSDEQRQRWLAAAAALTRQLLGAGFTFRDLKPSNIVIDDAGRAQLVDVGSVRASTTPRRVARMLATMRRVLARDGVSQTLIGQFTEAVHWPEHGHTHVANERTTRTK